MATYTLEDLLRSPYCWNSEKFIRFWHACDDYCIRNLAEYTRCKRRIDLIAKANNIWNGNANWEIVLGPLDYDHMRTVKGAMVTYPTTSVSKLLRIIRNNHQHRNQFSISKINHLNWHNWCLGKWVCDDNKFVDYWIRKFPNFVPFIWEEFRCFTNFWEKTDRGLISPTYSKNTQSLFATNTSVEFFIRKLQHACAQFRDKGNFYKRSLLVSKRLTCTMEFGTLSADVIQEVLKGFTAVAIEIAGNSLNVRHYDVLGTCNELNHSVLPSPVPTPATASHKFVFAISQTYQDSHVVKNASFENTTNCNIYILTSNTPTIANMNEAADTVNKLAGYKSLSASEAYLTVSDLSLHTQDMLRLGNVFKLKIGNHLLPIKDVFANGLPDCLNGSTLNKLLQEKTIHLFCDERIQSDCLFNLFDNNSDELIHYFQDSGNGFNVLYGRPYIGKSFAAKHYRKTTHEFVFVANYQCNSCFDKDNNLSWYFTNGNPLSFAAFEALLNNNKMSVTLIVDGTFDEKLLLKNNPIETSLLECLSSVIEKFVETYKKVKCWLILRPYSAEKVVNNRPNIRTVRYKMTKNLRNLDIAKLVQKKPAMNGMSLEPSTLSDYLLKVLEAKFELSPIILSGLFKLAESKFSRTSQATDLTKWILLSEVTEVFTEAYFQHTSKNLATVAQPNKKIFQYMHFKLALELLRKYFEEQKENIEELEEQINMILENQEVDLSNDKSFILDYGLVNVESTEEFQFYDASVPFYFFALSFLVVRPYKANYLLWRTLLEYMSLKKISCTNFSNVMQMYHELGRKTEYVDRYKKILDLPL